MNKGRKKQSLRRITLLFICLLVLGYLFTGTDLFAREEQEVDYNESIDSEMFTEHPLQLAGFDELPAVVDEDRLVENLDEPIQKFSFVNKTFQTTVNQPVLIEFTSTLPADEVLIRVPEGGVIVSEYFTNGESVKFSHGEYWSLKTQTEQTEFELPVIFGYTGQYFLSIDHDADHFYLEVNEQLHEVLDNTIDAEDTDEHIEEELELLNSNYRYDQSKLLTAKESNLFISQKTIEKEGTRVLDEARDPHDRSLVWVTNWTQFLLAWNTSTTSTIHIQYPIESAEVWWETPNTRTSNIQIQSSFFDRYARINLGSSIVLNMSGAANLRVMSTNLLSEGTSTSPMINHSGTGLVETSSTTVYNKRFSPAISASNIILDHQSFIYNEQAVSPIRLVNGTLTFNGNSSRIVVGSGTTFNMSVPPITSTANSTIDFNGEAIMLTDGIRMAEPIPQSQFVSLGFSRLTDFRESWHAVTAQLTGINGSIVANSISNPGDFEERYLSTFETTRYKTIVMAAAQSEGFDPPVPSYDLSLQASPSEGGNPVAEQTSIQQGSTTTITANQNEGYTFAHWEIVSGTGSIIESVTSETTTFTMGNQNAVIRAVFEENQSGEVHVYHTDREGHDLIEPDILNGVVGEEYQTLPAQLPNYQLFEAPDNATGKFTNETISVVYVYDIELVVPVDPLDPEADVNPENKPELPENQGLLSIDFASKFQFGRQTISAQDQQYYAEPQRLLNEDGKVNEEERPNYVQISDRRSADERGGWQLAVTQNTPFISEQEQILAGARLRLTNQQLATAQNGTAPEFQQTNPLSLVPGSRRILLMAQGNEGMGTWIYRFGDEQSAGSSVVLDVPRGATPDATSYSTTLTWELSAVPGN